jgi:hypothetical protein
MQAAAPTATGPRRRRFTVSLHVRTAIGDAQPDEADAGRPFTRDERVAAPSSCFATDLESTPYRGCCVGAGWPVVRLLLTGWGALALS